MAVAGDAFLIIVSTLPFSEEALDIGDNGVVHALGVRENIGFTVGVVTA